MTGGVALSDGRVLRAWQVEALTRWTRNQRGTVSVVTGAGKTVFALACIEWVREREPDVRVLVVVPTTALMLQWAAECRALFGEHAVNLLGGGVKELGRGWLTISVVNTARERTRRLVAAGRWMVVADECHRYGAAKNRGAVRGEWVASLGLSATPSREYDTWFEEFVAPEVGEVIFEYDYAQALNDGVVTPFVLANYEVPLTDDEQERVNALSKRAAVLISQGADEDQVLRVLLARARVVKSARARIPAAVHLLGRSRPVRAIVFHEEIESAERLSQRLSAEGHRVVAYHSRQPGEERARNLMMFRRGVVDVLVTCRALDEGLDVPDVSLGLIVASTASTRQRIQRIGRVLRRSESKQMAEVATIYAGESERRSLELEQLGLDGVATVRWQRVVFG